MKIPNNKGKRRKIINIRGEVNYFQVVDEILQPPSNAPYKLICLQKLEFEPDHRIELRLGYYMIGHKPRNAGKWVWGQYALFIPPNDLIEIIQLAREKGWFENK